MALLGVNVDHVATLRQARGVDYPDPVMAAQFCQRAGADQITCHLREDRRHICESDLERLLRECALPINLEMAATPEMLHLALNYRPHKVTLVPERREEITTEGGLDVVKKQHELNSYVRSLKEAGILVSVFIDPEDCFLEASHRLLVDSVELHTGAYCNASGSQRNEELKKIKKASHLAKTLGFFLAVGHGLNLENIRPIADIIEIEEFNIGHSIIARSVFVGIESAVREIKDILR